MPESLFNKVKDFSPEIFFSKDCSKDIFHKIFKKTFFTGHLGVTASDI